MRKSDRAAQARRELDRKFAAANVEPIRARPRGGWIRAIRAGLGMSQEALAARLEITGPSVARLEKNELNEAISIGKLAQVARAMDCQLVYALVPNTNLENTVQQQARRVAATTLGYVAATMDLEDQAVEADGLAEQLGRQVRRVIDDNRQWTGR
ncbi:MAG: mobile mystery protein A [Acidimicrobiia bacterium]|nr:mobile mystery protein A [Acidimicrobiia bacterium]